MVSRTAHLRARWHGGRTAVAALALLMLAVPLAAQGQTQGQKGLRIIPLGRGDQVFVTFELRDGFTPDIRAAIDSGLKTTFTYTVDLRLDVGWWIDRTMATSVVTNSVEYDNLQRKYTLERTIDGRSVKPLITEDQTVVREWLTLVKQEALFSTKRLESNREYYVRVSATARPSYGSILWPFGSGTSAQTKFTLVR